MAQAEKRKRRKSTAVWQHAGSAAGSGSETRKHTRDGVSLYRGDAMDLYDEWGSPVVIVSDGPYGVSGFPGDSVRPRDLPQWYEPHVREWSRKATPLTTLWFWNTEVGWASVHPLLEEVGWAYQTCNIWNKGIGHVAGNSNTGSLRKLPVVTEVCVHYVKMARFVVAGGSMSMQEWLRYEWERTGLPLAKTNDACGVRNAATRKYFTRCHLWYFPPVKAFEKVVAYANTYGDPSGRPYFSIDGKEPLTGAVWGKMRAKFHCEPGVTNVWDEPAVRGRERIKSESKCVHNNQKPLRLTERIIRISSEPGDLVWEPFGGLCSAAIAAHRLKRRCVSAEILPKYYERAIHRLDTYDAE